MTRGEVLADGREWAWACPLCPGSRFTTADEIHEHDQNSMPHRAKHAEVNARWPVRRNR